MADHGRQILTGQPQYLRTSPTVVAQQLGIGQQVVQSPSVTAHHHHDVGSPPPCLQRQLQVGVVLVFRVLLHLSAVAIGSAQGHRVKVAHQQVGVEAQTVSVVEPRIGGYDERPSRNPPCGLDRG